jgi:Zn finger protein HypA/HybF involved in hydrogenase expression
MIIQNEAVKLDGQVVEPRHTIEIYCPSCSRDVDEAELAAQKCNDCGQDLSTPKQSVSINATSQPIGIKIWGQ